MTSCELPRPVTLLDTPHPQVGDMQRAAIGALDLAGCNVMYIVCALNEFDLKQIDKISHRFETWPTEIQAAMTKQIAAWQERNSTVLFKGITMGVEKSACVLALHWRPKA